MFGRTGDKSPGFGRTGKNNPLFNKKRPDVAAIMKQRIGDKNPNWNGGSSLYPYGPGFNNKLKESIRKKFNNICILCGKWASIPHHIDYDKNNNQEDNFVLLCRSCNGKVNKNRDLWEVYFRLFLLLQNKNS